MKEISSNLCYVMIYIYVHEKSYICRLIKLLKYYDKNYYVIYLVKFFNNNNNNNNNDFIVRTCHSPIKFTNVE